MKVFRSDNVYVFVTYAKVPDKRQTILDAKGVKCLFLGYCKGTKAYWLICLEKKKIIKKPDVVFFEDKSHLEDCPSGRIAEVPAVKVDISPKLEVEELKASGDASEPDEEEPSIEIKSEAEVLTAKSTCSSEAPKLNTGKKTATKPTRLPQYGNETIGNIRYPDRPRNPLGEW